MVILYAQVPVDGLVLYYPFNDNANDESGNGNHGVIYNVVPAPDRCGYQNKAFKFDGFQSEIITPNSAALDTLTRVSLCAWIKPVEFYGVGNNSIIDKGYYSHTDPYYQYHLGITGTSWPSHSGSFAFSASVDHNYNLISSPDFTWEAGLWYFVVGTYDGTNFKIYVNAELMGTLYSPGVIDRFGNDIYIGNFRNFPDGYTPGVIDDIRIYNRALSQEEIENLFNISCTLGMIIGNTEVCQGQQGVPFFTNPPDDATEYAWDYSGTGATIHGEGNSISIDFASNATSGSLILTVTSEIMGTQSRSLPVTVYSLPSAAGTIIGEDVVCQKQNNVLYIVPEIEGATYYNWNFSGSGASIAGSSNNVLINFSVDATSGDLTVAGGNVCGYGPVSAALPVVVDAIPADPGIIDGDNIVCNDQKEVSYSVQVILNATGYVWNYSESGVSITGNTNQILVDFSDTAASGMLTVTGQNRCGTGETSADYAITVITCNPDPIVFNIPNSFSPNGDGINDFFVIRGLTENSKLKIFNRAGKVLYESGNYHNDWDGRDSEWNKLKSGTYWFVLTIAGIHKEYKGFVYLKN